MRRTVVVWLMLIVAASASLATGVDAQSPAPASSVVPGAGASPADFPSPAPMPNPCISSGANAPTVSPSPTVTSAQPPPTEPVSTASASPGECPLGSVDELLAPASGEVDREAILAIHAPLGVVTLELFDLKSPPGPMLREDVEVPVLPEVGAAVRLCADGSVGETARERMIDRQRGCFLAVMDEWRRYRSLAPGPESEAAFADARAAYLLARDVLGPDGTGWLDDALRKALAAEDTTTDPPDELAGGELKTVDSLLTPRVRRTTGVGLLRAIRDVQAAAWAQVIAPIGTEEGIWDFGERQSEVGWFASHIAERTINHVSRPAMCIHDLRYLEKVPARFDVSGTSLVDEQSLACWYLLQHLWYQYQDTGNEGFYRAASLAWAMLRKADPDTAEYISRNHRLPKGPRLR